MLEVNFNPFPQITTTRLLLRKIELTDADALYKLRSNEKVMRYIDKETTKTVEEASALIQKMHADTAQNNGINWCICLADQPAALAGIISFWRLIKENHRAEMGYMLHTDHWRKGLMQEAAAAVIQFGFNTMKLHSIEARINPHNAASAGLLEKMGFVREAYFKEDYYFRGAFLDTAVYSLLHK